MWYLQSTLVSWYQFFSLIPISSLHAENSHILPYIKSVILLEEKRVYDFGKNRLLIAGQIKSHTNLSKWNLRFAWFYFSKRPESLPELNSERARAVSFRIRKALKWLLSVFLLHCKLLQIRAWFTFFQCCLDAIQMYLRQGTSSTRTSLYYPERSLPREATGRLSEQNSQEFLWPRSVFTKA